MDKKGIIVIVVCGLLIAANLFYSNKNLKEKQAAQAAQQATQTTATTNTSGSTASNQSLPAAQPSDQQLTPATATLVTESNLPEEKIVTLENDFIRVVTTTHGGGIKRVELKKHKLIGDGPVILNYGGQLPIFNIQGWTQNVNLIGYQVASSDATSVTFTRELQPGLQISRKYTLGSDYSVTLEQTVSNSTQDIKALPPYILSLGVTSALHPELAATENQHVAVSWYTSANSYSSAKFGSFSGFSLLGFKFSSDKSIIESPENAPIRWGAARTQFFALITRCDGFDAKRVEATRQFLPDIPTEANAAVPTGIVGTMTVNGFSINPGSGATQKFSLYAGPTENSRLENLPDNQARIMEFNVVTGFISRSLLWLMNFIHGFVKNYGIAIICVTIILRAILWWPQSAANRSMKRMQAVAPVMKEIQEKYKGKPDKLNAEMLKIYKEYGVNPVGGCLPMLIQFPIFIGFFGMLQSAIELRHEHFLWIHDLSQPDTLFTLGLFGLSIPVNLMPLIMTGTMYISMRMTPQPTGVDNPMMKAMKFMPLMFLVFCYNYSAALSLYWTAQNILSIIQMRYNLKQVAPSLEAMKAQAQARKKKQLKR